MLDVQFADIAQLSYEDARDELVSIVARLEGGQVPLEESMQLWRRGEALAGHCSTWLDGAEREITDAAIPSKPREAGSRPDQAAGPSQEPGLSAE